MTNEAITQGSATTVIKSEERQEQSPVHKDVNPYATQQRPMNVMVASENTVDFSVDPTSFGSFQQPQVFTVLDTPETPMDASILSGKASTFVEEAFSPSSKVEVPIIERPEVYEVKTTLEAADADFEQDPSFALYHTVPTTVPSVLAPESTRAGLLDGINLEKFLPRFYLVDSIEQEAASTTAFERIGRISASLDQGMEGMSRPAV